MKTSKLIVLSLILCGMGMNAYSQCVSDVPGVGRPFYEVEIECAKANSEPSYLSDGKDYRALLTNNSSEFIVVFYSNNKYRISACTDVGGPLSFTVKDHKNNILFNNKDYENAPYWDLVFPTTIECMVTVTLPEETRTLAFGDNAPAEEENASESDATPADSGDAEEGAANGGTVTAKPDLKPVCAVLVIGYKQE